MNSVLKDLLNDMVSKGASTSLITETTGSSWDEFEDQDNYDREELGDEDGGEDEDPTPYFVCRSGNDIWMIQIVEGERGYRVEHLVRDLVGSSRNHRVGGAKYMSYLTSQDIAGWLMRDYDDMWGPFDTEQEALKTDDVRYAIDDAEFEMRGDEDDDMPVHEDAAGGSCGASSMAVALGGGSIPARRTKRRRAPKVIRSRQAAATNVVEGLVSTPAHDRTSVMLRDLNDWVDHQGWNHDGDFYQWVSNADEGDVGEVIAQLKALFRIKTLKTHDERHGCLTYVGSSNYPVSCDVKLQLMKGSGNLVCSVTYNGTGITETQYDGDFGDQVHASKSLTNQWMLTNTTTNESVRQQFASKAYATLYALRRGMTIVESNDELRDDTDLSVLEKMSAKGPFEDCSVVDGVLHATCVVELTAHEIAAELAAVLDCDTHANVVDVDDRSYVVELDGLMGVTIRRQRS